MICRERLHVIERILAVGLGVVWHDSDSPDTDLAQRLGLCHDAADTRLHVGAVITDEDKERALWPANVGERIGLAVDAFESEVTCLPTERANAGLRVYNRVSSTLESQAGRM